MSGTGNLKRNELIFQIDSIFWQRNMYDIWKNKRREGKGWKRKEIIYFYWDLFMRQMIYWMIFVWQTHHNISNLCASGKAIHYSRTDPHAYCYLLLVHCFFSLKTDPFSSVLLSTVQALIVIVICAPPPEKNTKKHVGVSK